MNVKQSTEQLMTEELTSVANLGEKQMLLQKYGMIEPKLTEWEQIITRLEAQRIAVYGPSVNPVEYNWDAVGRTC